jgi:hypothetical protein
MIDGTVWRRPKKEEGSMATAQRTKSVHLQVKPFVGELPQRKVRKRAHNPFDDVMSRVVGDALASPTHESGYFEVDAEASDLKSVVAKLRSALRYVKGADELALRTWTLDHGLVFQVGPKARRARKKNGKA